MNKDDLNIIRELGIVSQLRGLDGAGIFEINSKARHKDWNNERLVKSDEDWNSLYFFEHTKGKKKILDSIFNDFIMGHVRAATVGSVSVENTHPFAHGTIVGAHNGTLRDARYLQHGPLARSDSDLFFEDVSQRGIEAVLADLDPNSAYAIVMYDRASKKFIFARNDKRTLYFALNFERQVMYWASEREMLRMILDRNGVRYSKKEDDKWVGGIFALADGVVWITDANAIKTNGRPVFTAGPVQYTRDAEGKKVYIRPEPLKIESSVVPFAPPYVPKKTKNNKEKKLQFATECSECKKSLKLVEQYAIRHGQLPGFYNSTSDSYWCADCVSPKVNSAIN